MALAYPEGEVFFQRSSLANSKFKADDHDQFYGHILVEYLWNQPYKYGKTAKTVYNNPDHPRSTFQWSRHTEGLQIYNWWTQLPFSYGRWNDVKRRYQHNLCGSTGRYYNRTEKGAAAEAWYMIVPRPTKEERWLWIDLLAFVRAIYIPVAQEASQQYPDLCTYYQVNFTRKTEGLKLWHSTRETFNPVSCDKTFGIAVDFQRTLGIDVTGICRLMALPRQLRKGSVYNLKMITIMERGSMKPIIPLTKDNTQLLLNGSLRDGLDLSYTTLAKASLGLELVWKPCTPDDPWIMDNFRNMIQFAIGFVPVVGFALQIAFALGWTALFDYENFHAAILSNIPGAILGDKIIQSFKDDAEEIKKLMPPGWGEAGNPFQIPRTQVEDAVDTTDKDPPPEIEPIGEAASFKKGEKVLAESATKPAPLVEINI